MRSVKKVGLPILVQFAVYTSSQVAVLDLTTGDFAFLLFVDGAASIVSVTVTEMSGGCYEASFTPPTTGTWYLMIRHATYNKRGWQETFDVTSDGIPTLADIAAKILDTAGDVDGYSVRQALKLMGAGILAKCSGEPSNPVTFRSMNDLADRIVVSVDADGNRVSVTLTP